MDPLLLAYGLAVVGIILGLGSAVVLWRLCAHFARFEQNYRRQIQGLQAQLQTAAGGAVGMGQRLVALESRLQKLSESQDHLGGQSDNYAYTQAMHMFDQGADIDTVVSSCGLSSSEAQLMALMREQLRPSSNSPARPHTAGKPVHKS